MSKEKYTTEIRIGDTVIRTDNLNADTLLKVGRMDRLLTEISWLEGDIKRYHTPKPLTKEETIQSHNLKSAIRKNNAKRQALEDKMDKLGKKKYIWKCYNKQREELQLKKQQMKAIKF